MQDTLKCGWIGAEYFQELQNDRHETSRVRIQGADNDMQHGVEGAYELILYMHGNRQWMSLLFLACEAHCLVTNKTHRRLPCLLCLTKYLYLKPEITTCKRTHPCVLAYRVSF
jgi:hypothetical protein